MGLCSSLRLSIECPLLSFFPVSLSQSLHLIPPRLLVYQRHINLHNCLFSNFKNFIHSSKSVTSCRTLQKVFDSILQALNYDSPNRYTYQEHLFLVHLPLQVSAFECHFGFIDFPLNVPFFSFFSDHSTITPSIQILFTKLCK